MNPWGVTTPAPTESVFFNAARWTTFLLLEGHSDERFWRLFVDRHACQLRPMGGRAAALKDLATMAAEGRGGFVAVLDADFDRINGTLAAHPHVVWTDGHDLETMFIVAPSLDKVLSVAASQAKLDGFATENKTTVREALFARGAAIAELRWLSQREQLTLTFRKKKEGGFKYLDYHAFCEPKGWVMDREALVRTVLNFSSRPDLKVADLRTRMSRPTEDLHQLCVGHDLVGLLMVGLRAKLGSRTCSMEELEELLCLAFERAHLEQTGMYQALCVWEQANAPYQIF